MKETTIKQIAPKAERIVSLYAAAELQFQAAKIKEDGSVEGANNAQVSIDKANEYRFEAAHLQAECRAICHTADDTLPGIEGLKKIAATAYARA